MKRIAFVSVLSVLASASWLGAQEAVIRLPPGERVAGWVAGLHIDPGVRAEMMRFEAGGSGLGVPFVQGQAERLREAVTTNASESLRRIEGEGCRPSVEVSFPQPDLRGTA